MAYLSTPATAFERHVRKLGLVSLQGFEVKASWPRRAECRAP